MINRKDVNKTIQPAGKPTRLAGFNPDVSYGYGCGGYTCEPEPKEIQLDVSYLDCINNELIKLKQNEPTSDNQFFRLAIINYELGDLNRAIVYSNRFDQNVQFGSSFKNKSTILAEGKLAAADLITQINMLCISLGWDFQELRRLGLEHLKERQKDFIRDGWSEVKE